LYLARSEESMSLEHEQDTADQPISPEHFEKLREVLNNQEDNVIEASRAHWVEVSGGVEFANEHVTRDLLKEMLTFVKSVAAQDKADDTEAELEADAG